MKLRLSIVFAVIGAFVAVSPSCDAAGWGTLKGKFVLKGEAPELQPLSITKDQFCIDEMPKNNFLVVNDKGEVANVFVYLRPERGKNVEVHPDYEAQLKEPVTLDNQGCLFVPHITLVRTGQPLIVKNSDPVAHNTNLGLTVNPGSNEILPAKEEKTKTFTKEERLPMPVTCNIHPWMKGHIFVKNDPYMAVTGEDGTFEIKNIPAGEHDFVFWQELPGYLKEITVKGKKPGRRGDVKLTIPADGELNLGTIEIPGASLK
jgi:hypothetical protein